MKGARASMVHMYFSLIPEALIISGLEPEEFGQYYATGHQYKSKGQAVFFEVDPDFRNPYFEIDAGIERCTPHPDGRPKNSMYVSIYRVLEHLPVSALGKLYLSTAYGHTLGLNRAGELPSESGGLHLYHEFTPANSLVVSALDPAAFYASTVNDDEKLIGFPGLCFVELQLGQLAEDPIHGHLGDLPYDYIHHLREALLQVSPEGKQTKMVHRVHALDFPYRMVKGGYYVGNGEDLAFYPMPTHNELRTQFPGWWRSAHL